MSNPIDQNTSPVDAAPTGVATPPSEPATEVLAAAETPAPQLRPRGTRRGRTRLTRRGRIVLFVGLAVVLVLALVAGLLVATALDDQAAAEELRTAQQTVADAESSLRDATARIDVAALALDELVTATDAGLAVEGTGIDKKATAALQAARDTAVEVQQADGSEVAGLYGDQQVTVPEDDDRAAAAAHRQQAELYADDAERASARSDRLETAAAELTTAIAAYLGATQAEGAALLTDRTDAADETRTALQERIDALATTEPAALAEALEAYRQAVDAVISSSDQARAPTPGGHGIRVSDPTSITVVVNKRNGLAADYVPPDLVLPSGIPNNNGQPVRKVMVPDLKAMQAAMAAEGITLRIGSAYRSYYTQQSIYNRYVSQDGQANADTYSARPGNSEHQTGLAVDLDDGRGCNLNVCFRDTPGGKWLAANSWKYGFILRYGEGWQPIVGYRFEPWHYRYVGIELATDMHEKGIRTLEEYYGLPAAPDYD